MNLVLKHFVLTDDRLAKKVEDRFTQGLVSEV